MAEQPTSVAGRAAGVAVLLMLALPVAAGVPAPAVGQTAPALPATVHGVTGDGGLPVEDDLAVGPASVVVANASDIFVVTAQDGAYHRLRLPGYDAALYDAGAPGVSLSPDGLRLGYAWHGRRPATGGSWVPSGIRVLDLVSGTVRTGPSGPSGLSEGSAAGVLAWNLSWSPDSRFVAYTRVPAGPGFPRSWLPGGDARQYAGLLDAATNQQVVDRVGYSGTMRPQASPAGALVLVDDRDGRRANRPDLVLASGGGQRRLRSSVVDLPVARISPDGAWLAQSDGSDLSLRLQRFVGPRRTESTELLSGGAVPQEWDLELLGWASSRRLLAVVHRPARPAGVSGQGSTRTGSAPAALPPEGDLVTLTLGRYYRTGRIWRAPNRRIHVERVGRISGGDPGTAFSFATDLAAGARPTREFGWSLPVDDGADASSAGREPPGGDPGDAGAPLTWVLLGVAAVAAAGAAAVLASSRRQPRAWHDRAGDQQPG